GRADRSFAVLECASELRLWQFRCTLALIRGLPASKIDPSYNGASIPFLAFAFDCNGHFADIRTRYSPHWWRREGLRSVNLKMPVNGQASEPDSSDSNDDVRDHLADALIYLAAYHGRAISQQALIAGLPTVNGRLSASLVERAGQRAGLEIEPV